MKKVLLLGAGMCSHPIIHYLDGEGYALTVASRTLERAQRQIEGCKHAKAVLLDIAADNGEAELRKLIPDADVVISLLPYVFHPKAAAVALSLDKHFLTASYTSDGMRALNEEAVKRGLVVINECGVDPGTDHMSAMKIINRVHKQKGKLVFFTSYAGGLPSPKDEVQNPFGYKFSWAPMGVLLAGKNSASFYQHGKEMVIDGKDLFNKYWKFEVEGFDAFEVYPNRDSKPYKEIYGIPEVQTLIRGTLRNQGWCQKIKKLVDLGYVDDVERTDLSSGISFAELTQVLSGAGDAGESLIPFVAKKLNVAVDSHVIEGFKWLGLFSKEEKVPASKSALDALCTLMQKKMPLGKDETDLMLLRHTMIAEFEDRTEYITSTLVDYGTPGGETSMSRTTSLPLAIAAKLVLEGEFTTPGLSIPIIPELYDPIMKELNRLGIRYVDEIKTVPKAHKTKAMKKEEKKLYDQYYKEAFKKAMKK